MYCTVRSSYESAWRWTLSHKKLVRAGTARSPWEPYHKKQLHWHRNSAISMSWWRQQKTSISWAEPAGFSINNEIPRGPSSSLSCAPSLLFSYSHVLRTTRTSPGRSRWGSSITLSQHTRVVYRALQHKRCQLGPHPFLPLPNLQLVVLVISAPWRFQVCSSCHASRMQSPNTKPLQEDRPLVLELTSASIGCLPAAIFCPSGFALTLPNQASRRKAHCHLSTWALLTLHRITGS